MRDKKSMVMVIVIGIVIAIFLFVNTTAMAKTGTVVGDNLRVRKEENTDSAIIDLLDKDAKVEILGENGDWYKVNANGKIGYVNKQFISVDNENKNNTEKAENTTTENTTPETKTEETENTASENTENTTPENTENKEPQENNEQQESKAEEKVKQPKNVKFTADVELKVMPTINSIAINSTSNTETYTVVSTAGAWSYVKANEKEGWALSEKATDADTVAAEQAQQEEQKVEELPEDRMYSSAKTYYVKGSSVNVRTAASKNSDVYKVLNTNYEVKVIGEADSWYIVEINGDKAYVAKSLLTTEKIEVTSRSSDSVSVDSDYDGDDGSGESYEESSSSVPSNPIGSDVVEYALQFQGYSYVYGTNGPNTFDCSGFVQYVYKHFGIYLSRSSSTQANDGVYVDKDSLEPGDVLIFRDTSNSRIGHVGLYIGDGEFIHASNSRTGVIISSLSSAAYQKRYVCARRIL